MIDTVKENLCINKIVGSKTFTITAQGDTIIPDIKPDILNAINMTGKVCIYKKETLEGKVRLDGNVNVYLMYLADSTEKRIRGINGNIDFSEILDFPGITPKMMLDEEITIKQIECKVLNGRKVSLKAMLEIKANAYMDEKEEIIKEVTGIDDIQSQKLKLNINSLIGQNTSKTSAKETLMIDTNDNLLEILSMDFTIKNKDSKISYNKVLAKADIEVDILYLTEDGRIKKLEETIPVMGFIDLVGVSEDSISDIKYKLRNIIVKPNSSEEHSIYVEIELEINCRVFENREVNIIQDMYSPSRNLNFKENKVSTLVNMRNAQEEINVREKINLEDSEHTKISEVYVLPNINKLDTLEDKVKVEGELDLNFILTNNSEDDMTTLQRKVPFDFTEGIDGLTRESKVNVEVIPTSKEFAVDNNEVTVKVNLGVSTSSYNLESINVIDNIEESEETCDNPYSMVIYFVKQGDTLWKIAKKYKSTVEDIARINNIENPDKIDVGMQLFIPKCGVCRTKVNI